MNARPTKIALAGEDQLEIEWSDGQRRQYSFAELRQNCPCATCREKRKAAAPESLSPTALPVIQPSEAQPLKVLGMTPVGNYAYAVAFNDGHDTGIFPFALLRQLGRAVT